MKNISDKQNIMNQELFIIRNKEPERDKEVVKVKKVDPPHPKPSVPARSSTSPSQPFGTSCPPPSQPSRPPCQPRRSYASSRPSPRTSSPSKPPVQQNSEDVLFIGDSISTNVDIGMLEDATKSKFKTSRAYSSIYDTENNIVV